MPILTPPWWRSADDQIAKAGQLWPGLDLPEPPSSFTPRSSTEVLLLHVPRLFDDLWSVVEPPNNSIAKYRWNGVEQGNLRLAPNKSIHAGPIWLAFDPEHGVGERASKFWERADIAASEVLSAIIQFPGWPVTWFYGASAPNLAGYRLFYDNAWLYMPGIYRWDSYQQLVMNIRWADFKNNHWASPTAREC